MTWMVTLREVIEAECVCEHVGEMCGCASWIHTNTHSCVLVEMVCVCACVCVVPEGNTSSLSGCDRLQTWNLKAVSWMCVLLI